MSSSRFWNQMTKQVQPYTPGEQSQQADIIKLNTNENPFPLPDAVLENLRTHIDGKLRLYPEPTHQTLRQKISAVYGINSHQVAIGNGSDELLNLVFRSLLNKGESVVIPDPTYSLYEVLAQIANAKIVKIPCEDDFSIKSEKMITEHKLTILANPNPPSGAILNIKELEKIASGIQGVLLVDEAYIDFGGQSALPLLAKYDNIIIIRTLSKAFSSAGLRLGYAFGSEGLIEGIYRIKDSYNVNMFSQLAALEVFEHYGLFKTNIEMVIGNREYLVENLAALDFDICPSQGNFVLTKHVSVAAIEIYEKLAAQNILIRHFRTPRLQDWLRISVGSMQQIKLLVKALKKIVFG